MIVTNPYEYPVLTRHDGDDGIRCYDPGYGRPLPSVTTILSGTKDNSFLQQWRQSVGEEEADKIVKQATDIGSALHENLEHWILSGQKPTGMMLVRILTDLVIKRGLSKVDEVWGVEVQLYKDELYAGTTDLVGVHQGTPAIMDFKNSRKFKQREWIEDYFLQLVAYGEAHNERFQTDIQKGVIMMAVRDGRYQEFIIEGDEWNHYKDMWYERLYVYYDTHYI